MLLQLLSNNEVFFQLFHPFVCSTQCFCALPLLIAESGEKENIFKEKIFST